jgi:PIN domain nuclease of toxin-antitoxin system
MGMSYLIDTCILLWWIFDDPKLYIPCRDIIRNPDHCIFVSSASAWEIAIKYRKGNLPEAEQLVEQYSQMLNQAEFIELAITSAHALRAGNLPIKHDDPFDRMIIAQAELENLPVITSDAKFPTELIQVIPNRK